MLASHAKEQGGGVAVTRVWKRGGIDYKRVPELAGVDLEQYRGTPREETRVQVILSKYGRGTLGGTLRHIPWPLSATDYDIDLTATD
jgi:hypothetical protein